jgi:hypothetical protein
VLKKLPVQDAVKLAIGTLALAAAILVHPASPAAQPRTGDEHAASLEKINPGLHARLVAVERAQALLFGALAATPRLDEADVFRRVTLRLTDTSAAARPDPEADSGLAALGARGAEVVRRTHALHRDIVAAFASVPAADRKRALDAALARYRNGGLSLPDAPKDMTILYDHPYTTFVAPRAGDTEPHRELPYPKLTGILWSTHWYELAVLEPLEDAAGTDARERDLAQVEARFRRKLSFGAGADTFPTELPLAPAIAPGLVAVHEGAAAVIDNLNMMLDVIADVLVHPNARDRRAAVNQVIAQFTDRAWRCVQADEWIVVALRHSIFAQGGFALRDMNGYERNAFGHGQHYAAMRAPPPCNPQ